MPWYNQCTRYCRVIVLIFVIAICVYIMFYNHSHTDDTTIKEKFEAEPAGKPISDSEALQLIETAYQKWLKRAPEAFEVDMYLPLVKQSGDNIELERRLKQTTEYQYIKEQKQADLTLQGFDAAQAKNLENTDFQTRMDMYKVVLAVYERTLERLPNARELNYYTYKLITDPKHFTEQDMEKALMATPEYEILSKLQNNQVYGELPGNITQAQIKLEVEDIYTGLTGKEQMTVEMETFLLAKYKEYNLDKVKLQKLIMLIENLDLATISPATTTHATPATPVQNQEKITAFLKSKDKQDPPLGSEAFSPAAPDTYELVEPSLAQLQSMITSARANTSGGANTTQSEEFTNDVMNIIRTSASTCGPTNRITEEKKKDRDSLSEYTQQRNLEALRYMCTRDTFYDYGDDYAVMYPNYKQIAEERAKQQPVELVLPVLTTSQLNGTLLDDAKKTNVGSILPKFIYKEF